MPSKNPEQLSSELRPETPQPEGEKAAKPEEGKRFELPDLEDAKTKEYPWAKTAESARNFLSNEITDAEDTLKQLTEGVKEGTALHKQIQRESYFRSKEREKKGEVGTPEGDFFAAIEDLKTLNKTKLETINQRWQRLDILSSETKGAQDEELNKLSYEKTEGLRKKGKKVDDIECNDKARQEMIAELKEKITGKDVKKEIERREKDRVANLNTELKRVYNEVVSIHEVPGEGEERKTKEKIAKELYEKAREITKALTGEDLQEKARERAKTEAESEGYRIITKREYLSEENIKKQQEMIKQERDILSIRGAWLGFSDKERQKYGGDITQFARTLEERRKKLEEKGISLSKEVYYELLGRGYNLENIKIKGIFRKKIVLLNELGGVQKISLQEFKNYYEGRKKIIEETSKQDAKTLLEKRMQEGAKRWREKQQRHMRELIKEAIFKS